MGSFVYGYVTAQRAVAPPGESQASAAPGMTTYIDTLAALVPAEALALYAGVVVPNVTRAVPVTGKTGTVISDPALLDWSCAGLMVLSAGLYIVGRLKEKHDLSLWDIPRALIPLAAFTAWMLVQSPGVFDVWWPGSSMAGHVIIAAFTTIVLGALAKALGYQADQAGPPAAGPPAAGPRGGGARGRRTHSKMIARENQDHSPERPCCVPPAPAPHPAAASPDR